MLSLISFFVADKEKEVSVDFSPDRGLEAKLPSEGIPKNQVIQTNRTNVSNVNINDILSKVDKVIWDFDEFINGEKLYLEVKSKAQNWLCLNDKFSFDIASNGIKIKFKDSSVEEVNNSLSCLPRNSMMSREHFEIFNDHKDDLIQKDVLAVANSSEILYQSSVFFVFSEHRTTKTRLIFNMKKLNKSIVKEKFSMVKISNILHFLEKDYCACSLDISSAFYHLPIHKDFQKYFSFSVNNVRYKYLAMPFGLTTAPYLFTKFTDPIWKFLREHFSMIIVAYLDDILIIDKTKELVQIQVSRTLNFLRFLGFKLNLEKSQLIPSRQFVYLGVKFDTETLCISNSELNISKCICKTKKLLEMTTLSRRDIERFLGLLNFMVDYLLEGRSYIHELIKYLNDEYPYCVNRDTQKPKKPLFNNIIQRWSVEENYVPKEMKPQLPNATLRTDASLRKWGAVIENRNGLNQVSRNWGSHQLDLNINNKELLAIFLALKEFRIPINSHLSIFTDNRTAVSVLKKGGTHKNTFRHQTVLSIIEFMSEKRSTWEIHHLPGRLNILADFLSRQDHIIPSELQLSSELYSRICIQFGLRPEIDLFATHFSSKCINFISSIPHPKSLGLNAFTHNWGYYDVLYAFPPPSLMSKTLYKWKLERKGSLILIAPAWPSKMWYPILQAEKIRSWKPAIGPRDLFLQTTTGRQYMSAQNYHLTAFLL